MPLDGRTGPPATPVVRPAARNDLGPLQELARRTIDARYRSFLGDEAVDHFLGSGASDDHVEGHFRRGLVHCMEADQDIVGLVILDGPTIDLIMIDVDRQRQGLGRALLAHAEDMLFADYEEIRLESFAGNHAANAFYESCGWSKGDPLVSEGAGKIEFTRRRGTAC